MHEIHRALQNKKNLRRPGDPASPEMIDSFQKVLVQMNRFLQCVFLFIFL